MKNESERITELEIGLAHLQRQYELLNAVVTEQSLQLDRAIKRIEKWEHAIQRLKNDPQSPADPIDEKPPHY